MRYAAGLRGYARPLRVVAILVAVAASVWEVFSDGVPRDVVAHLLVVRAVEASIAIVVAVLASPHRSLRTLRTLLWVLALDVAGANCAVMAIIPAGAWEALMFTMAALLGAALFAPWSWRWQGALSIVVTAAAVVSLWLWVPPEAIAPWSFSRVVFSLVTIGIVSVLGTHLMDLERRRVVDSEARYRGLFDGAGDAIAVLGPEGTVREVNARLREMVGWENGVTGTSLADVLQLVNSDHDVVLLTDVLSRITAAGSIVRGRLRQNATQRTDVEVAITRLPAPGEPLYQAIIRDLTRRRAQEQREALAQRYEAVGRFAGTMAHQFNNLLAGILTQTSLLQADASDENESNLHDIAEAARRGEHLTKALLRFTPHYAVTARPLAPLDVLRHAAATAASPDGVPVGIWAAPDLPPLAGDIDHLADALVELVRNAREACVTRPDGVITLTAAVEDVAAGDVRWRGVEPGRYVRLSVIDQGVGMDRETQARLFEPFFTTKALHEVTGVGMSCVYWVARAHRGGLAVDSKPESGTSVHMIVPAWSGAQQRSSRPTTVVPHPVSERPDRKQTVLVVDDEPFIRDSATRALERLGYAVLAADDGDAGFALLARGHPPIDLAILDVVMPAGGAGLVERMRRLRPDLPILIWSGFGPGGEVERMLAAGASGFLQKPYEIPELRDAVAEALTPAA